jgi:hypothetical protein
MRKTSCTRNNKAYQAFNMKNKIEPKTLTSEATCWRVSKRATAQAKHRPKKIKFSKKTVVVVVVVSCQKWKRRKAKHDCPQMSTSWTSLLFSPGNTQDIKILNEKKLLLLAKRGTLSFLYLAASCSLLRLQRWVRLDNFGGYLETKNRTFFVRALLMGRSSVRARHRQKP